MRRFSRFPNGFLKDFTMKDATDDSLDRRSVRRAFDASADRYDEAAVLQRHVADELMERIEDLEISPARILDLGSGTGYLTRMIVERFPGAEVFALDISPAMARRSAGAAPGCATCADAERVPFRADTFDLVVSNMTLQWCDFESVFGEARTVLAPGGLLLFSTVGPDTLMELRESWRAADEVPHVHDFVDMHHLGDALLALGFENPVLDIDRINLTYPDVGLLLRDLKTLGVVNARSARARGLLGRRRYAALIDAYEAFRDPAGELPSTWEVVYGHAWFPAPGSVRVAFDPAGSL